MFTGSMVALITPFQNGKVDYKTIDELIAFHLDSGTDGIVPVGTTGECPTLSHEEHKKACHTKQQGRHDIGADLVKARCGILCQRQRRQSSQDCANEERFREKQGSYPGCSSRPTVAGVCSTGAA